MGCGIIIYSTYPTEIQGTGERMLVQGCLLQQNVLFQKLKRMPRTISREPLCLFIWKALPAVPESRFSYISRAPTHGTAGSHLQGGSSTWTSSLPWIFTHSASVPTPATHTHTPQSPSFLNFNYFLLEDSLSGLYNQNDFIKLCCKNHAFIPKSWQPTVCLFRKTLVYFGLHPNIFQKEGPFFVAGTPHAGCNGNLGSLPLVIAPPFYFGEPRERGDLSPRAWVEPPYRLTLSTWPQSGQSEIPELAQRWSRDPIWANGKQAHSLCGSCQAAGGMTGPAGSHLAVTWDKPGCKWKKDQEKQIPEMEKKRFLVTLLRLLDPTGLKVRPTSSCLCNHMNQNFSLG